MLDKTEVSLLDLMRSFSYFIGQWWKSGILGVIIGVTLGFTVNLQSDKYYIGSFTIGSTLLSDVTMVQIIDHLNDSKKVPFIDEPFDGCPGYDRSNIRNIQAKILDNDVNKGMIKVQYEIFDPNIECPIDQAILHYISVNPYVKSRLSIEEELTKERLDMVNNRIAILDSLSKVASGANFNSSEYALLLDYKYETSKIFSLVNAGEILTPASTADSPENSKVFYMAAGAMFGFFLSFVYTLVRVIRMRLNESSDE